MKCFNQEVILQSAGLEGSSYERVSLNGSIFAISISAKSKIFETGYITSYGRFSGMVLSFVI